MKLYTKNAKIKSDAQYGIEIEIDDISEVAELILDDSFLSDDINVHKLLRKIDTSEIAEYFNTIGKNNLEYFLEDLDLEYNELPYRVQRRILRDSDSCDILDDMSEYDIIEYLKSSGYVVEKE